MDDADAAGELTPEQLALIARRQAELRAKYDQYVHQQTIAKVEDICRACEGVTKEQAQLALGLCENDELYAIERLLNNEPAFLEQIKRSLESGNASAEEENQDSAQQYVARPRPKRTAERDRREGFNVDGSKRAPTIHLNEALERLQEIKTKKETKASPRRASPRKRAASVAEVGNNGDDDTPLVAATAAAAAAFSPEKRSSARKKSSPSPKAAAAASAAASPSSASHSRKQDNDYDGYTAADLKKLEWSDARIKAFLGRKSNPNAYYYRFNAPGEPQATGGWTASEHQRFMKLIENGVDYKWGLLSMHMPGRVGYQCSNYYRKLVQDGSVKDPNYVVEDGKLKFLRSADKEALAHGQPLSSGGSGGGSVNRKKKKPAPKRRRGDVIFAAEIDSEPSGSEDEDSEVVVDMSRVRRAEEARPEELLLPDIKDAMTALPMLDPALSPFGHVLDYSTWLRVLKTEPINTCPFTKQRLTRRSLIKLTPENIVEMRSKIIMTPSQSF